jgi:hypothetical protein
MKKITLLILFFPLLVFSQKCKFETNEFDEFTKKEVKIVKEKQLTKVGMGFGDFLRFDVRSMDGNKFIRLHIYEDNAFSVRKDGDVMFLTTTDEVITLHYTESTVADYKYFSQMNHTQWSAFPLLYVDEENFQKLINSEIKKVRWYRNDGYLEKEVNPKHTRHLAESLKCLLE